MTEKYVVEGWMKKTYKYEYIVLYETNNLLLALYKTFSTKRKLNLGCVRLYIR